MGKGTKDHQEQKFRTYCSAHKKGRFYEAEKGYQEILKIDPDQGEVLNALGNLFLDRDRPDKAKPIFEKAANLNPPNLSACYNLGRMKQLENDHSGAIATYKAMLNLQPNMGHAWNNLGVAYRDTGKPDEALSSFRAAVKFAPEMAEAWNNLGVAQDEQGLAENALKSYQRAIEIQPEYLSPHLNIGISLQKFERFKEAEEHYKKVLKIQPDNQTAEFMLQSIGVGGKTPDTAPVEHVRNIFDQCAQNFEALLVKGLQYKTPERLFDLVHPHLTEKMKILDLGCGTGLGAHLYRPFAENLTGVDVSSKMLEKAYGKKLYDRLEIFDILEEWTFPEKFDLIYSSDVFVYFGNLNTIIRHAGSYLVTGGKIAFSVEKLEDTLGEFQLFPSGRYAHSQSYIQDCLNRHGLDLIEFKTADVRSQSGKPVKGLLIVAGKPTYEELEKRILALEREKQNRLQIEDALRESESSFSQLFESAPVPMAYAKKSSGYTETIWNTAWYKVFGYSKKEAEGRSGKDIGFWADPADRSRLIAMANRQNYAANFETRLVRKDGSVRDCILFGRFIEKTRTRLLMIIYLDVTEQKQVEKERDKLRHSLSNIIDSMPSVLVGVDAGGKVTLWNKTAELSTGVTANDARGKKLSDVFPKMSDQIQLIAESIRTRKVKQRLKIPATLNGITYYEDITIFPLTGEGMKGAVIRLDDVSEKVRMEIMIMQNEKMLSLGGLAAGMAHEINNPLAGMIQTANLMSNRLGGGPDIPANIKAAQDSGTTLDTIQTYMNARGILPMISTIRESGKRVAEIVNNMLNFARKNEASVSSHYPEELLETTLELAATDYDLKRHYDFKAIEIVKEYEGNLPMVSCHEAKIQQVLLNVLRNGAQAMHEYMEIKNGYTPRFYIRLMLESKSGMLRIEIEDNGPGIDEDTCKRIFEPFFTTKPVGVGTGLGLSISYFIVTENHGGQMSVDSILGAGTKFIICLPLNPTN